LASPFSAVTAVTHPATPTVSSVPSEIDVASVFSENDTDSDVWEDASRAPSPDEFVIVYDSAEE